MAEGPTPAPLPPGFGIEHGDVTCDGKVDSLDALRFLQLDAGLYVGTPCMVPGLKYPPEFEENAIRAADTNEDGRLDSRDALNALWLHAGCLAFYHDILPSFNPRPACDPDPRSTAVRESSPDSAADFTIS